MRRGLALGSPENEPFQSMACEPNNHEANIWTEILHRLKLGNLPKPSDGVLHIIVSTIIIVRSNTENIDPVLRARLRGCVGDLRTIFPSIVGTREMGNRIIYPSLLSDEEWSTYYDLLRGIPIQQLQ